MCVQRFDDSLNSAIHITYRISLRSSSMPEPRDPSLKVLKYLISFQSAGFARGLWLVLRRALEGAGADGDARQGGDGPPRQRMVR